MGILVRNAAGNLVENAVGNLVGFSAGRLVGNSAGNLVGNSAGNSLTINLGREVMGSRFVWLKWNLFSFRVMQSFMVHISLECAPLNSQMHNLGGGGFK